MLPKRVFAKMVDYTYYRPDATRDDILTACRMAKKHHFAALCVLPYWMRLTAQQLHDTDVKVCAPIGFPLGATTISTKIIEAKAVIAGGATEVDIMINLSALKSGRLDTVRRDLEEVLNVVKVANVTHEGQDILTKLIIETCYLTDEEKRVACHVAREVGVEFLQTCTDFGVGRASLEDLRIIRDVVGREIGIKTVGGINTLDQALLFLDSGANRIGTSMAVEMLETLTEAEEGDSSPGEADAEPSEADLSAIEEEFSEELETVADPSEADGKGKESKD